MRFVLRLLPVAALAAAAVAPAQTVTPAQVQGIDKRVGKLESEMRAVQRKVFPGGDAKFFPPEMTPEAPPPEAPAGTPATSAVADLTVRVDGLERQLRDLTGAVEKNDFRIRQLEESLAKFRADAEFRLTAIETGGKPADAPAAAPAASPAAAKPGAKAPADTPAAKADAKPPADPNLDPVEAAWREAYAPVEAKDYAKAEQTLPAFIAANPKAARASSAQYWLGRTFMAQEKYAQAAKAFLDGYQKYPKGVRAPDSLLWLGNALIALKKPDQACRSFNELDQVYGAKLSAALKTAATEARAKAKCPA